MQGRRPRVQRRPDPAAPDAGSREFGARPATAERGLRLLMHLGYAWPTTSGGYTAHMPEEPVPSHDRLPSDLRHVLDTIIAYLQAIESGPTRRVSRAALSSAQRAIRSGMCKRWADEFERSLPRSPACARDRHDECPHLHGFGGGFNPRRLRLEFGAGLCPCDCHSSCPITSKRITISARVWRESCTCPGAEAERISLDEAGIDLDFDEAWAKSRQESRSRREAFQAARDNVAGKSREEIREMYISELRLRGLKIPRDEVLDAAVDALTGNYQSGARVLGQSLIDLMRVLRAFRRPG